MAKTALKIFFYKGINMKDYGTLNEIFVRSDSEEFQDISRTNVEFPGRSRTFQDKWQNSRTSRTFQDMWPLCLTYTSFL